MAVEHPVVGSWRISVEIPGGPPGLINLARLSTDGGVVVAFPSPTPAAPGSNHRLEFWTPALGSWSATGDRNATMVFVALGSDENGAPIGTHTVTASITANGGGHRWQGPFTITIAGPDRKTVASLSGAVTAIRIDAEIRPTG